MPDVYLYAGEASPNDVRLRTAGGEAVQRLYFAATTAAPVSPIANGIWTETDGVVNRALLRIKSGSGEVNGTFHNWTAGTTQLDRYYVSEPMMAQTLLGQVKCQLKALENNSSNKSISNLEIYVVSNDGSTVRGTLLTIGNYHGSSTPFNNPPTNENYKIALAGTALSTLDVLSGDRIVVATGFTDNAGTSPQGRYVYGEDTTTPDLPEDNTQKGPGLGWIEFSEGIVFQSTAALATATFESLGATATAGGVTTDAALGTGTFLGLSPTATPGAVTSTAILANGTFLGLSPDATPGAVTSAAALATGTFLGLSPTATPGPLTATADIGLAFPIGLSPDASTTTPGSNNIFGRGRRRRSLISFSS